MLHGVNKKIKEVVTHGQGRCVGAQSAGGANALPVPCLQSRPSVAPAGVLATVWHLYRAIFTDLNTNGYCLIVSRFISQTSPAPAPAQLLQSKPLSLNRPAYCLPIKRIDLRCAPFEARWGPGRWDTRRFIKTSNTRGDVGQ